MTELLFNSLIRSDEGLALNQYVSFFLNLLTLANLLYQVNTLIIFFFLLNLAELYVNQLFISRS